MLVVTELHYHRNGCLGTGADLRRLICSRGGQVMAFPHTLIAH